MLNEKGHDIVTLHKFYLAKICTESCKYLLQTSSHLSYSLS